MATEITLSTAAGWRIYWGGVPLPVGAEALGVVARRDGIDKGALLRLASGIYVQGNAGVIRTLPQGPVRDLLAVGARAAAAAGGRAGTGAAKARTSEQARAAVNARWSRR